jgi:hypothetical protein
MQEYFAADYINRDSAEQKDMILERIINSSNIYYYSNLINIYSDLDKKGFQQKIVLPVLDDYITYVDSPLPIYNQCNKNSVRLRRQILYHTGVPLCIYVLTDEEYYSRDESGYHKVITSLLREYPTNTVSQLKDADWLVVQCAHTRIECLFRLIIRKYPHIKSHFRSVKNVQFIEKGRKYVVSEDLFINNPNEYDELNTIVGYSLGHFVSYDNAMRLRNDIEHSIRENEDVLKGLLKW